jgi:hypothetical protein
MTDQPSSRHFSPTRSLFGVAIALSAVVLTACGAPEKPGANSAAKMQTQRPETISHDTCDVSGRHVEALDTNGDGKPDIYRVFDGSKHELCRVTDLNRDGKPDLYEYFDDSGAVRRREFCYGDTGEVNAVETYQRGRLVERAYDTTGQHKLDTWDWFDPNASVDAKTGRPAHPTRRERDLRGSGMIDQWWTWEGDKVTIATDRNGDGAPDPESTMTMGGDAGGVPAAPAPVAAAPADDAGVSETSVGVGVEGGKS